MDRAHFIGRRAYHEDSGHRGRILNVRLDLPKPTALFHHDRTEPNDARWVNLEKLKLLSPHDDEEEADA